MADELRVGMSEGWQERHQEDQDRLNHGMLLIQFFKVLKSVALSEFDGGMLPVPFWKVF
jgi:hypothetical protein